MIGSESVELAADAVALEAGKSSQVPETGSEAYDAAEELGHMVAVSGGADSQAPAFVALDYSARPVAGSLVTALDTAGLRVAMARNIPEELDGLEPECSKLEGMSPALPRGTMSTVRGRKWEWATLYPGRQQSLDWCL